jgi:hypothetical protein
LTAGVGGGGVVVAKKARRDPLEVVGEVLDHR